MNWNLACHKTTIFARMALVTTWVVAGGFFAEPAHARLGTFSPADGYQHFTAVPPGTSYSWSDVAYYNAGDHGTNVGGGSLTFLTHNTGNRWNLVSSLGSFFPDAATRNAALGVHPPYPVVQPTGGAAAYMVGAHFNGRNNDGYNLAFRNDTALGTGPVVYDYYLDSYDMGVNPASITSGSIETQFYFLPTLPKAPVVGSDGTLSNPDKFSLSFMDTNDNIGLQWGYAKDNEVYWRTNTSGPWNYTGVYAANQSSNQWDGVKVSIDLSSDTFGLDYYDVGTNTWSNMVAAGTPLGTPLQDFTKLRWQLEDDGGTFFAGKEYFDDFSFSSSVVPEPGMGALGTMAILCGLGFRRKRAW